MHRLTQRLRELRQEKNWRQKDVADKLGITESAYGYYEQGRREPSVAVLEKLSQIYGVTVDYLLGLTDDSSPPEKKPFAPDLTGKLPDLTPEEVELLSRLAKEVAFKDYLEAPEEAKNRFIEAVKLLLRGIRQEAETRKEGREMYILKKFRVNEDGSTVELDCYWDPQLRQPKIYTDRAEAEGAAERLNGESTDSASSRWKVVPIQL